MVMSSDSNPGNKSDDAPSQTLARIRDIMTKKGRSRRTVLLLSVVVVLLSICHMFHHHWFLFSPLKLLNDRPVLHQQQAANISNTMIVFGTLDADASNSTTHRADPYSLRQGLVKNNQTSNTCPSVCAIRAGQGLEDDGGWKLLTEQIRVAQHDNTNNVRILCAIYTHAGQHDMVETITRTWGKQCDGFVAFSTETHPSRGIVNLIHAGPEAYGNMWQKVRSIWGYVHQHYLDDFDFFHLCGDDTYVIVPNLRRFLQNHTSTSSPLHFGQWIPHGDTVYTGGGPGYTLNRAALALFVEQAQACHASTVASYEDRLLSMCLQQLGVYPADTRDHNSMQLYHDVSPHTLYLSTSTGRSFHARASAFWETKSNTSFIKLQNAGPYSVAFHDLFAPCYLQRVHAILYPYTCPHDSVLARELRRYQRPF